MFFDRARVLKKYDVSYFRCPSCGFIQTEDPYWLEEAYAHSITRSDIGYVQRNIDNARLVKACLALFFPKGGRFVDQGGGYGMLVRIMRDLGFDFYRRDKYCENLFAETFEADPAQAYDLTTCFEVFEHLPDPMPEIEAMLRQAPSLLFSTQLIPETPPKIADWWYYSPHHGQHLSFYALDSLRHIARRHDLHLCSNGTHHLLTPRRIWNPLFRLACRKRFYVPFDLLVRRLSLHAADYEKILSLPPL